MRRVVLSLVVAVFLAAAAGCPWDAYLRLSDSDRPLPEPFVLGEKEQAEVDRVFEQRDRKYENIRRFGCKLVRREYNPAWNQAGSSTGSPISEDTGKLCCEWPNRFVFEIEGSRPEKWIVDQESIHEYRYDSRTLIEHQLPDKLKNNNFVERDGIFSSLAVMFSDAETMKKRFSTRVVHVPGIKGAICLELIPQTKEDAWCWHRVELMLDAETMLPLGLRFHAIEGKSYMSYTLYDVAINETGSDGGDPFSARAPRGWTKVLGKPQGNQPGRPQANQPGRLLGGGRR